MSILIRGMVMPRVCAECFMDPPCCKSLSGDTNIWKERHPDCPLVEVKEPHGKLIDVSKLNMYDVSPVSGFCVIGVTEEDIELANAVIEAEGSEE